MAPPPSPEPASWPASAAEGWTPAHVTLWRVLLALFLPALGFQLLPSAFAIPEMLLAPVLPNIVAAAARTALGQLLLVGAMLVASAFVAFRRLAVAGGAAWLYLLACLMDITPVPLLLAVPAMLALLAASLSPLLVPRPPQVGLDARGRAVLGVLRTGIQGVIRAGVVLVSLIVAAESMRGTAIAAELGRGAHGHALGRWLAANAELPVTVASWLVALAALAAAVGAPRLRGRLGWVLVLGGLLSPMLLVDTGPAGFVPALAWLLAARPTWVPPAKLGRGAHVFFDGECGLCHAFVRLGLEEDRAGAFTFAPLQGATRRRVLPEGMRVPDSMVVRTAEGRVLVRSAGVRHVLSGLGGAWRILGAALGVVPVPVADFVYRLVAAVRRLVVRGKPPTACPVVPAEYRSRLAP